MASILDDERFQNLQLGLAKALRTMRTEGAALRKRRDEDDFEREKFAEKSAFEREKLATQEERERLSTVARLPGSAGVEAQARLVPGVSREKLQREDVGRTYIEDLLSRGQYGAASDIAAPLGIRGFTPSAKEEADTGAARALELQRREQTKNQARQSQALTFLYGQRAKETQKKIEKIDRGLSGATSISQLKSASDIFRNELDAVTKQLEALQEQPDYLQRDDDGNFIDRNGKATTRPELAAVNPTYIRAQDDLIKNEERLRRRLSELSGITGEAIELPGEAEDDLQAQIDDDLELLGDADPETARAFLLKKYPEYLKEIPRQSQVGPEPPPPNTQQRAFGPQLPMQREQQVVATPEQKAAIQKEFNALMQNRPAHRSEEEHKKVVLEFLSRKYAM